MGSCALVSCIILQGIGRKATVRSETAPVLVEAPEDYALALSR